MNDLPDEDKLKYFRGMITEEEKLDMGLAPEDIAAALETPVEKVLALSAKTEGKS